MNVTPSTGGRKPHGAPLVADEWLATIGAALAALLTETPPILAVAVGDPVRPWRIGLGDELRALLRPDADPAELNVLCKRYIYSPPYQIGLARAGGQRHAIDGSPVGPVDPAHRHGAATLLAKRKERRREREAAERAAKAEEERLARARSAVNGARPTLSLRGVVS